MTRLVLRHSIRKGDFSLNVDTKIPAAGVTGVYGESGSGKTTLLRCIAGLEHSTDSSVVPVHKRRVGYVFQEPQLFSHFSVRRNIEYGMRRNRAAVDQVDSIAEMLGVHALLDRSPAGLSGGEAQRVSIARVLCQAPKLILMDEPLSSLDEKRRDEVLPYLDRLHAETSIPIIYVSHSIDEICRLSDYLIVLDKGRVAAEGELHEALTRIDPPPIGGRSAGAVLEATQLRYDEQFDLTLFAFSGGEIWSPGRYSSAAVRLRIRASDISLSKVPSEASTILNVLPATIESTAPDTAATELLRLRLGDDILVARITRKSLQQLQLRPGDSVYAQIKSVTVRR